MVTRLTQSEKNVRRHGSKQVARQKEPRSVTCSEQVQFPPGKSLDLLEPWFQFVNLLPPPPALKKVKGLRSLLDADQLFQNWLARCRHGEAAKFLGRFERSGLASTPAFTACLDLQLLRRDPDQVKRLLELACEIAGTFRRLVMASHTDAVRAAGRTPLLISNLYKMPATTSRSEIWVDQGAVTTKWVDPFRDFMDALKGADAARIRQCLACNRFFFALRKDQKACTKQCNAVRRVRDWRANQAEYEYRRKLKSAGLPCSIVRKKTAERPK